jgi:hypothetical protein
MNIVGAAAFVVNRGWNGPYPSAGLKAIWVRIGVVTLLKMQAVRRAAGSKTS